MNPEGQERVLYTFQGGTDGNVPYGPPLLLGGYLYGTTYFGGNLNGCYSVGCGIIYRLDPSGKLSVLHTFTGGADGGGPYAGLTPGRDGSLYGMTGYGGDLSDTEPPCYGYGSGVVFKLALERECMDPYLDDGSAAMAPTDAPHPTAKPRMERDAAGIWRLTK